MNGRHLLRNLLLVVAAGLAAPCLAATPKIISFMPSDFNGDGHADILWRHEDTGLVYRMLMFGSAVADAAVVHSEPDTAWKIVATGDFNADGKTDLLWRHDVTGAVYMMLMDYTGRPAGGMVVYTEPDPAWKIVDGADLDADGFGDILWWNADTGHVYLQLMRGILVQRAGFLYQEPDTDWRIAACAHFSGRGTGATRQLLWHNARTGAVYVMNLDLSGETFAQSGLELYAEPDLAWRIVSTPDLDGDGRSDILWHNEATGQVFGMLMSGMSIVSRGTIHYPPDLGWKIVATYDYDLNGRSELLWRHEADGRVHMMWVNGLAVIAGATVHVEPDPGWRLMGPREYARQRDAPG